jgi:hypothetical protein
MLPRSPNLGNAPRRFRFSVLEANAASHYVYHSKPLPNAICKNCKQSDHLVQRPLVDPTHVYFCTNCGQLTPTRAIRHKRGLMAPTIQQGTERDQSGIAQPASPGDTRLIRVPKGIHTMSTTNNFLVDSLTKKGYQIISSDSTETIST